MPTEKSEGLIRRLLQTFVLACWICGIMAGLYAIILLALGRPLFN